MPEIAAHPFPLIRAGGAFLIVAGALFALGWRWPRHFAVAMAAAFGLGGFAAYASLALPPELGPAPMSHMIVLIFAFAAEIVAILWMYRVVRDERRQDAWVLFIVGAHFVPMVVVLGPLAALLGALCMANAVAALRDGNARPILAYGLLDSALKIAIGSVLFLALPRWGAFLALS